MARNNTNSVGLNDLLFNILIGFVLLFIIAFLMINPITKKSDVPSKSEIMIVLEWDKSSIDDIDLWVYNEGMGKNPLSFKNKNSGLWHLDRDDLGISNDKFLVDGIVKIHNVNREVATMRGIQKGDVHINIHVYTKKQTNVPVGFKLLVLDINPYKEIYSYDGIALTTSQIFIPPSFTVNDEGEVVNVFKNDVRFAARRGEGG